MATENFMREGFLAAERAFTIPAETAHLEKKLKRELTICNLFLNHQLSIDDIIRVLDEGYENVVLSLIAHGVVADRRSKPGKSPLATERRRSMEAETKPTRR